MRRPKRSSPVTWATSVLSRTNLPRPAACRPDRGTLTMTELIWDGKYATEKKVGPVRIALPFQTVETVNETAQERQLTLDMLFAARETEWRNRLIWGDKKYILPSLLPEFAGKIDLIYIDPPFATGADFSFTTEIGESGEEIEKQQSAVEEKAYRDTWGRGLDTYLDMVASRLSLLHDLLSERGSLYVHLDATVGHYVKPVLDEVFGSGSFQREIIWRIGWVSGYKSAAKNWIRNHDTILYYVKNPSHFVFNKEYVPYPPGYARRGGEPATGKGYPIEDVWNANPFEFELKGEDSLDSIQIKSFSQEKTGYATQKNESILRRLMHASSNPGDLVADFFCGAGTTLAVAEKLGRRWMGCDLGRWAIHISRKRLLGIQGCKPFEVLNLGKYERQYWQGVTFGDAKDKPPTERALYEYLAFILKLYRAQPVAGMAHVHGKKG